ncbi:MAG: S-adenosylmethionine:tRNA ribosyltransferase-isomerase [Nocardioidaceae bacterium]
MSLLAEHPTTRFRAPQGAFASAPAEDRGLRRDDVGLLVAGADGVTHTRFHDLPDHLLPGDLVVVNDSATVAGQLDAVLRGRGPVVLHLATPLDDGSWVVELRTAPLAARAVLDAEPGDRVDAGGVAVELVEAYPWRSSPSGVGNRLWRATVHGPLTEELAARGRPIAYGYLDRAYPLEAYQTVFATRPGSAEMPSAARPFTAPLVARLVSRGIAVAPVTLHTGVSSQEAGEGPQPERFEVPEATARIVNAVRAGGGRIVAVGTTVTRALESAVDRAGRVVAASGWTDRVVTPARPPQVVTGLVTGWHDPQASHLLLVEAVAGPGLTQTAYDAAVAGDYLWHEFGDSALLLPDPVSARDRGLPRRPRAA